MSQAYEVTGELIEDRLVRLDRPVPFMVGRVRVVIEGLDNHPIAGDLAEFEKCLRERQAARQHVPRTKDEVDAYLEAERGSWDT